ncbi:MAG TPA: hypothetical protein P5568_03880 [Acidobacteriota bacterium]|nr:hypothetical protein [Acidobacteriota bacterium]HRR55674.1 hypothetical protein [Acidobacteriota bacterium]HRV07585.1 hypothetical protein [Acidobacteriota bacterium]
MVVMTEQARRPCEHRTIQMNDDQRMELLNISLELTALCRLFDHASCDPENSGDEVRRVYRDVSALLRPLCGRLDRLQAELGRR